ncbi:hypothetical protein A5784_20850 [Mycobacterium sp. 852013-50091_SCH5140682]|uniref:hypothetical protein n=1 Tax=Mycobacterium sp. 852013-50091_SCH5140682 TaxID=1834109 RepID=UPI0007E981BA|nr:hypothetical protein [Mycobacterium sp. 852013-50091_SCH5140682]OBC00288.1 hypothetical protein A5784_20850 [Mycobacterium sp. 852013-50091_SCH5140682]
MGPCSRKRPLCAPQFECVNDSEPQPFSQAIDKKIASIGRIPAPKTLDDIEAGAITDFELLLREQEKLAAERRTRLIQLERQKTKLIEAYMADALPVEDLQSHQSGVHHQGATPLHPFPSVWAVAA